MAFLLKNILATKNVMSLIIRNPLLSLYSSSSAATTAIKGVVYEKKPVKMTLEKDKKYSWCSCGTSKTQPFCDHSHREYNAKITDTSKHLKSVKFTVQETKDYHLCNCKQTKKPPFCDGTHKEKFIQDLV